MGLCILTISNVTMNDRLCFPMSLFAVNSSLALLLQGVFGDGLSLVDQASSTGASFARDIQVECKFG